MSNVWRAPSYRVIPPHYRYSHKVVRLQIGARDAQRVPLSIKLKLLDL